MTCFEGKLSDLHRETANGKEIKTLKAGAEMSMPLFQHIEKDFFKKGSKIFKAKVADHLFVYIIDDRPLLFKLPTNQVCPNLILVLEYPDLLPCVYVDEGAVRPLLNGASLMAPGIKECPQDFEEGAVVAVRLLGHEEAFALGIATLSSEKLKSNPKGAAIEIKHILKDSLWNGRDGI